MSNKLEKHLEEQGTYFTSVTHDLILAEEMKKSCLDFRSWAFIEHQPDNEEGTAHIHFLVRANGTRNVRQIADKLGISGQYVQVVKKVVAFRRYMLHLDSDEKIKYDVRDVHTNCHADFRSAMQGNVDKDVNSLFADFVKLSKGTMTPQEFIQLNYVEMSKMCFSQKIKTFQIINTTYGSDSPPLSQKRALTT